MRGRGRRYAPKNKLVRRARLARFRRKYRLGQGVINIVRKASLINTYANAGVAGVVTLNDPSGTCLSLGTPVLVTGTTATYNVPFAMKFRLDQLMNGTDITNIADKYKINSVKVKVHCNNINESYVGSAGGGQPWIEYIQDHDDAVVPTIAQMREKMGVRTKYFSGSTPTITMGVRPRVADAIYGSGVGNAYAVNRRAQFINSVYDNAEHYGIKGVLHNIQLTGTTGVHSLFDWDVSQFVTAAGLQ